MPQHFSDERTLDVVEQLVPLAERAGVPMTHLAMAFAIAHPGVTSAIIGPRTVEQLDDLLAGADATLDDGILDRIDEIAPPGTAAGPNDVAYTPPAISTLGLGRSSAGKRSAGGAGGPAALDRGGYLHEPAELAYAVARRGRTQR